MSNRQRRRTARKNRRFSHAQLAARRWAERAAKRIAARTRPERIILFGSLAYGRPGPDSDVDVLVVLKEPRDRRARYRLVDRAIGEHMWPVDLLVYSPEEIQARLRIGDPFFRHVLRRGIQLYES